jgi:hypothetical protein
MATCIVPWIRAQALRSKALSIMAQNAQASEWILQKPSPSYPASNATTGGPGAHMTAGLFGIKWFLMALADGGMNDLAHEVLTTPSYPGYRWMMDNAIVNATPSMAVGVPSYFLRQ